MHILYELFYFHYIKTASEVMVLFIKLVLIIPGSCWEQVPEKKLQLDQGVI